MSRVKKLYSRVGKNETVIQTFFTVGEMVRRKGQHVPLQNWGGGYSSKIGEVVTVSLLTVKVGYCDYFALVTNK